MRGPLLAGILLGALAFTVSAQAAIPFQVTGSGAAPDVAIDVAGTAHVVWEVDSMPRQTHYCRILAGRRGCARGTERVLVPPDFDPAFRQSDRAHVFIAGHRVIVVTTRCCDIYGTSGGAYRVVYRFSSADAGATFDAGAAIGTTGTESATLTPGGVAMMHTDGNTFNAFFQMAPLDGPMSTAEMQPAPGVGAFGGQDVGTAPDGRAVAAWSDNTRLSFGVPAPGANVNDASTWRVGDLGRATDPHLAGGGRLLWLTASSSPGPGVGMTLRRFSVRRSAFGRARRAFRVGVNGALATDPRGEANLLIEAADGVWYKRTTHHGQRFTRARRVMGNLGANFNRPRLAVNRRGRGLLVYTTGLDGGAVGAAWLPRR